MRRTLTIALGTAAALATAAVAVAVVPAVVGISTAKAEFSTAAIEKSKTSSCIADGDTWQMTHGHYTGTVSSDNVILAGPLKIHAKTTYNTTDKLGFVKGSFAVKDVDSNVRGTFVGTISDGKLVGYLTAKSRGNHASVLGNLSADFAGGATNFVGGQLGSDSSKAVLAVVTGPACKAPKSDKPKDAKDEKDEKGKRKHVEVEGEVTARADGPPATITVTGKKGSITCNVGSYIVPADVTVGTKVEMKCEGAGEPVVWTVSKLKKDS